MHTALSSLFTYFYLPLGLLKLYAQSTYVSTVAVNSRCSANRGGSGNMFTNQDQCHHWTLAETLIITEPRELTVAVIMETKITE